VPVQIPLRLLPTACSFLPSAKVKDLESKTGVISGEKKAELSGSSGNKEGDAMKDLVGREEVSTGVVPKSSEDAVTAIRAAHGEGDHKLQKLHEEKAEFKDVS
jgi:hypothetical protein